VELGVLYILVGEVVWYKLMKIELVELMK